MKQYINMSICVYIYVYNYLVLAIVIAYKIIRKLRIVKMQCNFEYFFNPRMLSYYNIE